MKNLLIFFAFLILCPMPSAAATHSLPPQPPSGGTLITVYTANPDKTYSGIILSGSYEAGHIHTYNVTLGNVHVDIRPADNDLPWNDGDIRPDLPPTATTSPSPPPKN